MTYHCLGDCQLSTSNTVRGGGVPGARNNLPEMCAMYKNA